MTVSFPRVGNTGGSPVVYGGEQRELFPAGLPHLAKDGPRPPTSFDGSL